MEFNTVHDFPYISGHDLPYLSSIFPTFPVPQIHKGKHKLTLRWSLPVSKASFNVKCGV